MKNKMAQTNLERLYKEEVIPKMTSKFKYKNQLQVPRLKKISINMGLGKSIEDAKIAEEAAADLALITGQKPAFRKAKKSISNFKIRKGMTIGCVVTLRKKKMYEFLDRLFNIALPRIRDFRGISPRGVDATGNFSLGIREHNIFPELLSDKLTRAQGMDISFATSATTPKECVHLLYYLGMPFRGREGYLKEEELN